MPKTNTNGHIQISPKYLPPDLYDYLKKTAKEKNLTETAIIHQALRLHKLKSEAGTKGIVVCKEAVKFKPFP